jgi:hypothetical protein
MPPMLANASQKKGKKPWKGERFTGCCGDGAGMAPLSQSELNRGQQSNFIKDMALCGWRRKLWIETAL